MTTELTWLLLTTVFAASLWIPYIVGVNVSTFADRATLFERPPNLTTMPPWVQRSFRAHLNLLEQFVPFAVIVLMAHMLNVSTPVTRWCVILFFWLRVAHAIGMISGVARFPLRPAIYVTGWLVTLIFAWTLWTAAR